MFHNFQVDVGDISEQLAVRERNKCKPFKWFMENVAFDLAKHYPLIEPPDYCNGTVSDDFFFLLFTSLYQKNGSHFISGFISVVQNLLKIHWYLMLEIK